MRTKEERILSRQRTQKKYKQSEKGKIATLRWQMKFQNGEGRERYLLFQKKWRKENREYFKLYFNKPENKFKQKARKIVTRNIKSGKLIRKSCIIGNCLKKAEAHHDDYDKPLDVKWLCKKHHEEYHHKLIAKE